MLQALTQNLPGLMQVVNSQVAPAAQAQLAADQSVSPGYANLQAQIYDTAGRAINNTGNQIQDANALAAANRDLTTLTTSGVPLMQAVNAAQQVADPEYYANRAKLGAGIGALLDAGASLTPGEMSQIERGNARTQTASGTLNSPSATAIAANALTYGKAGSDKFNNALQMATQALPALKSGFDAYQITTGKSGTPNTGDAKFMGAQTGTGSNTVNAQASGLLSQVGENQRNAQNINANRRTGWDQTLGALSGITKLAGSWL